MKDKAFLEKAEHIAVIFASLLGAVAFFWQVADHYYANQERANLIIWCRSDDYNLRLVAEIVNTSNKTIYVKDMWFESGELFSTNRFKPLGMPTFGIGNSTSTSIEIGASKEFEFASSREKIESLAREKNLSALVYSPSGELARTGTLYLNGFLEEADQMRPIGVKTFKRNCAKP